VYKFLNVGGNNKAVAIPPQFAAWEHHLLDIDPAGEPDILADARELESLPGAVYDAVYCSHNLEHYYRHEVPKVLAGMIHVLKADGMAFIRVPDIAAVVQEVHERGLDVEDILYESGVGPVTVHDVLYGFSPRIEASGEDFYAHKTGFSRNSLRQLLKRAGFSQVYIACANLEIRALAFKQVATAEQKALFGL
jgi:SAM-dependent methyltransferase